MKKHILLITYYFSPEQTPRAFRWEALIKPLVDKGYKIDILLPKYKNKKRPQINNVKYFETKQGVIDNIFYQNILNFDTHILNIANNKLDKKLIKIKKVFKKICSFFFSRLIWPDDTGIWYLFAKKELQKIIKNNQYDCIISSALPFTSHLLGYYAKKHLKTQWIAEYGDPFSFNPQPLTKSVFSFLNREIEKKIIGKMDYVVVPFKGAKEGFLIHFPFLEKDMIKVIPHIVPSIRSTSDKIKWSHFDKNKINIVYAGSFYLPIRNPNVLLEALVKFKKEDTQAYYKLRFHIFANIKKDINKIFDRYRELINDKNIILYGDSSRESCAFAYEKADYLLNIANISEYQLPSKLIEYLSYKKPIISFENRESRTPDWPFLIKINYQTNDLLDFFRKIAKNNIKFSFDGYNDIIKYYGLNNITQQYLNLITTSRM